jgi:hypothetical protein
MGAIPVRKFRNNYIEDARHSSDAGAALVSARWRNPTYGKGLAKELPARVAHEIDINQFQSIVEVFDRSVHKFRDRPAMANMDKILSYGQLQTLTEQFASYLQNTLQLKKGIASP